MRMFHIIFCFVFCSVVDTREYAKKLTVSNGQRWGSWDFLHFCPEGSYAIGFKKKVEGYQGWGGDDTALNGIRLICGDRSGNPNGLYASSLIGPWGRWTEEVRCDKGDFITAFSLKVEPKQGFGDDSAANNMKVMCRSTITGGWVSYQRLKPYRKEWGAYGTWSDSCEPYSAVSGIRTNIERSLERGDDTALNDLELYCCY